MGLVLLASALPAAAQQVIWKCEGPRGELTYQNAPCADGTVERKAQLYHTPDTPAAVAERARIEREMQQRNAALHRRRPSTPTARVSERQLKLKACKDAREAAQRAAFDGTPSSWRQVLERRAIDACFGL
jgi:hypothetical protein